MSPNISFNLKLSLGRMTISPLWAVSMDLMYATCSLSLTTAKKLAGQHTNGDVEEAMDTAEAARTAYIGFVRSEAAHNVSKI